MNPNMQLGIPPLEEYYMMMALVASTRANCLSRAVGAVSVTPDNGSLLATGYNGVPKNLPHCQVCRRREEGFGPGEGLHRSRAEHAERSVIDQASKYGRALMDSIWYVTDLPCSECCKGLINNQIKKVYYCNDYPGSEAKEVLQQAGIELVQLDFKKVATFLKTHADYWYEKAIKNDI